MDIKEIKPFIKLIPFVMLGICAGIYPFGYYDWFGIAISYLSQISGCSISTNVFFLYFIKRNNMCAYSLIATLGLLSLNVLDIVNLIYPFKGAYFTYMIFVSATFFLLASLALINKKCRVTTP